MSFRIEANNLLAWWSQQVDTECGGFWGEVSAEGLPVAEAPKSIILNTRLLWFFSAMARFLDSDMARKKAARERADRAAVYLQQHFFDREHGGVVWSVRRQGGVIDDKKRAYAQAFAVYAFAEYYHLSGDPRALETARALQGLIETHFRDRERGGYIEALSMDWGRVEDQRLSDKDADAPKTMNTHLHILEAYTGLHRVAPDATSRTALHDSLTLFLDRFVGTDGHLRLFFAMDWNDRTEATSYGHDIEASWLIREAARALGDAALLVRARAVALGLARATLNEGLNAQGGLSYEKSFGGGLDAAGEWWGQAEGMVGFVSAWQMSGERAYLDAAEGLWSHVQAQFGAGGRDEWTWYAADSGREPQYKAGMWKCPYHNGRAMIELDQRLQGVKFKV